MLAVPLPLLDQTTVVPSVPLPPLGGATVVLALLLLWCVVFQPEVNVYQSPARTQFASKVLRERPLAR